MSKFKIGDIIVSPAVKGINQIIGIDGEWLELKQVLTHNLNKSPEKKSKYKTKTLMTGCEIFTREMAEEKINNIKSLF